MFRDGLSFDEACGVLLSDPRVAETRDALDAMRQRLPNRPGRVPKGDGSRARPARQRRLGRRAGRAPGPRRADLRGHPPVAVAAAGARPPVHAPAPRVGPHGGRGLAVPGPRPEVALSKEGRHPEAPEIRPRGRRHRLRGRPGAALDARLGRGLQPWMSSKLRNKPGRVRLKGMTRPPARKVSRDTKGRKTCLVRATTPIQDCIAAHAERRLTGTEAARMDEHLADCPICHETFAETLRFALDEEAEEALPQTPPVVLPFVRRPAFRLAAILAVAASVFLAFQQLWLARSAAPGIPARRRAGPGDGHDALRRAAPDGRLPARPPRRPAIRPTPHRASTRSRRPSSPRSPASASAPRAIRLPRPWEPSPSPTSSRATSPRPSKPSSRRRPRPRRTPAY